MSRRSPRPALLSMAIKLALASSLSLTLMPVVQAHNPVVSAQTYNIPAGPLDRVLTRLAGQTGILLATSPEQVAGKNSPGVRGEFTVQTALAAALTDTGLHAVQDSQGRYSLQIAPQSAAEAPLQTVQNTGAKPRASTENDSMALGSMTVTGETDGRYAVRSAGSATGLDLSLRETPQSVSVITRQQMDDQNLNSIRDVLDHTAGVTVHTMGPAGSDSNNIYVRGFAVTSIQVDGVNRANNYGYREDLADMVSYERVEVIRGATGLMSGIGNPGATINLIRKKPTQWTQRSLKLSAGSWDNYRAELDVSGSLSESGHVRGRFAASYLDSRSHIDRQAMDQQVAYGILEWDIDERTLLTVGAEYQDMRNDEAGNHGFPMYNTDGSHFRPSRSFNSAPDWSYHKRDGKTIFSTLEHTFDNGWLVKFNAEHNRRSYDDSFASAASGTVNPDGSGISTWTGRWAAEPRQTSFDLSASGSIDLFGRTHDLYFGASHYKAYNRDNGYPLWTIQTIDNIYTWNGELHKPSALYTKSTVFAVDEEQSAAFASARWRLSDTVSLITGARVINWQRDNLSRNLSSGVATRTNREENDIFTPYVGLIYDFADNWSAYASYTTIFNPQNNKDVKGDYLDPEEGKNYELGIKGEFFDQRLISAFSVFEVRHDNLAVRDGNNIAPDGSNAFRAESGTKTRGFEIEVTGEVLPGWQLSASYTYAEIKDSDDDRMLTEVPRDTFKLFTSYTVPTLPDLRVGGGLRWQGSEYYKDAGPNGETFKQKDYILVDLMAQYAISPELSVALNFNNIFDERYYTAIGSRGWYGTPRNLTATLRYDF